MLNNDKPTKVKLDKRFLEVIHNGKPICLENYYNLAFARRGASYITSTKLLLPLIAQSQQ